MMKESPIYSRYEGVDHDFDPQVDFLQFLEEARKHTGEENFKVTAQYPDEAQKRQADETKKKKKSWKRSLFSWWKTNKKINSSNEPLTCLNISEPGCRHLSASGLLYGSRGRAGCKPQHPKSAPLESFFPPTKRAENEMPYVCLDKLNNPHNVQSYGPVYLVT
ncbi:hypothetical protein U1Q18_006315 [Sarracenia purpurea var. burkii]